MNRLSYFVKSRSRSARRRPDGLTLIEAIVVLAIIAILAALVLPAIQRARTTSLRIACANRLRQLGLAIHHYANDYGTFPPAVLVGGGGGPWSVHLTLLPYIDQANVYHSFNLGLFWESPANTTTGASSLRCFLCPGDVTVRGDLARPFAKYGFGNYVSCTGSGVFPGGLDAEVDPEVSLNGVFSQRRGLTHGEIPDGLSHTAAFSETVHGGGIELKPMQMPIPPTPGVEYHFAPFSPMTQRKLIDLCSNLGPNHPPLAPEPVGAPWFLVGRLSYNHLLPPNYPRCIGAGYGGGFCPKTASSRHSGIVHVAFADGHISPFTRSVDLAIWRAFGSRDGGEAMDAGY